MKQEDKKMITLTVKFWTNNIAPGGKVAPKQMWDSGMARIEKSNLHGIESNSYIPFNSMASLPVAIEKLLISNGLQMQLGKSAKYYAKDQLALAKKK